ncbi:MAG: hypothetical protein FJ102_15605 [Deltaproteobacteria bacterium]|nr:hypothetical protein [Deltaproteobacteria bacterium]
MILLASLALAVPPRAATQAMVASYHLARGELVEARRAAEIVSLHDRAAPRDLLDQIMVAEGATLAERELAYGGPLAMAAPVRLRCDEAIAEARRTPVEARVEAARASCGPAELGDLLARLKADPLASVGALSLLEAAP